MATEAGDNDLLLETEMLRAGYFYNSKHMPTTQILALFDSLHNLAAKKEVFWLEVLSLNALAVYNFYVLQHYETGLEYHERVYGLIKNLSPEKFPYKQICLGHMGDEHYYFKDYRKAVFFFRQSLQSIVSYDHYNHPALFSTHNTLGLCYQELGMYDSADYFFDSTIALASRFNNIPWLGIASGNKGYNFYLKKNYAAAIPLLQKDVEIAIQTGDWGLAANSLILQANINLLQNNVAAATLQVLTARQYVYRSGQYNRLKDLYPLLSKWYAATGQPAQAALFLDSTLTVKDSVNRKFSGVLLQKARQKAESERLHAQIASINHEKKIKTLQRNALIMAVLLLISLAAFAYSVYLRRFRQKQLDLERADAELQLASRQLADFTRHIQQNNELIELLQQKAGTTDPELLQRLQQSTLLTDDAWEQFTDVFEKVHGGYLIRLRQKIPGLTPAETRFMALAKIKLNNKEMAASLGIGTNAVRNTWFRLRKKLNLPEEFVLEEFVETI